MKKDKRIPENKQRIKKISEENKEKITTKIRRKERKEENIRSEENTAEEKMLHQKCGGSREKYSSKDLKKYLRGETKSALAKKAALLRYMQSDNTVDNSFLFIRIWAENLVTQFH